MANKLIGLPFGKDFAFVSENKILNKVTGMVSSVDKFFQKPKFSASVAPKPSPVPIPHNIQIKKEVEYVVGIDKQVIDLSLANSSGRLPAQNGFLVEVFLSGSDGKLTKVFKEDVVDVLNDDTLSEGFVNYLILEVDK